MNRLNSLTSMLLGAVLSALIFTAIDNANDQPQTIFPAAHASTFDTDALRSLCPYGREVVGVVGRGQTIGCVCKSSTGTYSFEPMTIR